MNVLPINQTAYENLRLSLLKAFEQFKHQPYKDSAGLVTLKKDDLIWQR